MKYLYISLIILVIILIIIYFIRKKRAIKRVKNASVEEKLFYVNSALEPFGFTFDFRQDIVVSKKASWQREVGYMDLYDLKAPFFNMVFDALPVYFEYNQKKYRIEFWKGQYGITTGAEVGIYVQDKDRQNDDFYRCANEQETLDLCFRLYKDCLLFERNARTWWLTGFDVGNFSKPKDLMLKACIRFSNMNMLYAFVKGLMEAGYTENQIYICENYVCFDFCHSLDYKINHRHKLLKCFMQIKNRINCWIYNVLTRPFNRTLDKLTYIKFMLPCLYRFIIKLSVPRRKYKKYCKKSRF